jgi:concentrative nucleoside transporter, CNT family
MGEAKGQAMNGLWVYPARPMNLPLMLGAATAASPVASGTLMERLHSLLGFVVITGSLLIYSRFVKGSRPGWRLLGWGIGLQFIFGAIVVKERWLLKAISDLVDALLGFTRAGTDVVFGDLGHKAGAAITLVRLPDGPVIGYAQHVGYFAFFVIPTIIFFSALMAVLYHIGVLQWAVQALAWVMSKSMGTSGAETLSSAANIFVGQTEAPLMVKPFLEAATRSELMAVMTAGFANIATGVLGLYTDWLSPFVPGVAGHLAAACFITAPGSLLVAKLLIPEVGVPVTAGAGGITFKRDKIDTNLVDAASRGTSEGLALGLNVAAMLITFTALIALLNTVLGWAGGCFQVSGLSLEYIFGWVFRPLAWLIGVPWAESGTVGSLLGIKTVLNELIAYSNMRDILTKDPGALSDRSRLLATYALCGFANFASIGIQVGGISTMAPTRRADLSRLGLLAMIGGGISSLLAACVVGVLM